MRSSPFWEIFKVIKAVELSFSSNRNCIYRFAHLNIFLMTLHPPKKCFALSKIPSIQGSLQAVFNQQQVKGLNDHHLTAALHFEMPDRTFTNRT